MKTMHEKNFFFFSNQFSTSDKAKLFCNCFRREQAFSQKLNVGQSIFMGTRGNEKGRGGGVEFQGTVFEQGH